MAIELPLWKEKSIKQCGQFDEFKKEAACNAKGGLEVEMENVKKTFQIVEEEALPQASGEFEYGVMSRETHVGIKEVKCNICGFVQIAWIIRGK